jgi:regulator of G-protein signaling
MEDKPESKLDDYEEEYLKKLKVIYYKHWLYVTTHAETELNLSKKFNRNEKQILDSQERAFWDLHKPMVI